MNKGFPFHQFNSPLHRAWKTDRMRRQRMPLSDCTRGCVGLAALWNDIDAAENHGDKVLYPNDAVSWIALRDLPPGCFPRCGNLNRRDVNYVNSTVAKLVHGMPCIDFSTPTRDAIDFRMMPFSAATVRSQKGKHSKLFACGDVLNSEERAREFGVFNALSRQMTDFAFNAQNDRGRPVKPAWFRRGRNVPVQRIVRPAEWFPKAYLGFAERVADSLYDLVTHSSDACGQSPHSAHDRRARRFSYAFKAGICNALSDELQLYAAEKCQYLGVSPDHGHQSDGIEKLKLTCHQFLRPDSNSVFTVHLPPSAEVQVSAGDIIDTGEAWCSAFPFVTASWKESGLATQWGSLGDIIENVHLLEYLAQLWFQSQAVRLKKSPNLVFFPAALVAPAVARYQPAELFWDFAPTEVYADSSLDAAILPPLRASRWNDLRYNISDVRLNASVGDPRFQFPPDSGDQFPLQSAGGRDYGKSAPSNGAGEVDSDVAA